MAIYSFHLGTVSRSAGGKKRKDGSTKKLKTPRSCQAAAAYKRAGKVTVAGQTWDYSRKQDVTPLGVCLPRGSPPITSEMLWIKADAAEKRKDSTTAREGHAALPVECTRQEHIDMIHEFAAWMCETHKVAFDANYHAEEGNPHVDYQFTTREYLPDGTLGSKTRQFDDMKTGSALVEAMRAQWAAIVNRYLQPHGITVDHRSYERQEVGTLPQIHLGQAAAELEAKGLRTERGDYNRAVQSINTEQEAVKQEIKRLQGERHAQANGNHTSMDTEPGQQKLRKDRHHPGQPVTGFYDVLQGRRDPADTRTDGEIARTIAGRTDSGATGVAKASGVDAPRSFSGVAELAALLEKANNGELPPSNEIAELAARLAALENTVAGIRARQAAS